MPNRQINRRQAIKILTIAAGTGVLSFVPSEWKTPVIEVGALPAHAQGSLSTGTISGGVFVDAGNNNTSPVPGATVAVDGTALSAVTGTNGLYAIPNVPAGTFSLTCTNTGGFFPNPDHLSGVVVTAGHTTPNQNFILNLG